MNSITGIAPSPTHDDARRDDQGESDDDRDKRCEPPPGELDADARRVPDRAKAPFEGPRERGRGDDEEYHADDARRPQLLRSSGQRLLQDLRRRLVEAEMLGEDRAGLGVEARTQRARDDQDRQDRREHVRGKGHAAIDELEVAETANDPQHEPPGRRPGTGSHQTIHGPPSHGVPHEAWTISATSPDPV